MGMKPRATRLHKQLSEGEQAIWAAAFVAEIYESKRAREQYPAAVRYDSEGVPDHVSMWVENAWYAVWLARNAVKATIEGFGDVDDRTCGDVTQALKDMLW